MKRLLVGTGLLLVLLLLAAPAASAADRSLPHTGRVLIATEGDITVPAGDRADLVLVTGGTATVRGEVNTVVVVDGTVLLEGARAQTIVAVRTPITLGEGTVVVGDVLELDSAITRLGDARIDGSVRDLALDLAGLGLVLGPALLLLYVGFAMAAIAAGLVLAGLAARQVRTAERAISREPLTVFVTGVLGIFLPLVAAVVLFVTVVGAPLAIGVLLGAMPAAAFVGYLIAAIWLGDWALARLAPGRQRERPYLAAVTGVLILQVLGIWPLLAGIASTFGYGALLLVAWRTFRGTGPAAPVLRSEPLAVPQAG